MSVKYTEFRPRWHREPMSVWWWLHRRSYLAFVIRELSSLFVAWFVIFLLLLVNALAQGQTEYQSFLDWSANPGIILLNTVTFAFVILHTITWFKAAPQAMVVRARGKRVPPIWVAVAHYLAWAVLSVLVAWLVLG